MPIHDWTRVDAGTFHAFHYFWIATLCSRLNDGCLPRGFFAMPEQRVPGPELDVVALQSKKPRAERMKRSGGTAVIDTPPRTRFVEKAAQAQADLYARKADRIAVHHGMGTIVAF